MSGKLNPPIVENKIVAQTGNTIKIPFLMNRSVGYPDYTHLKLIVKSVQSNKELFNSTIEKDEADNIKNNVCYAEFPIPAGKSLNIGQYYKAQIAYKKNNNIGFYSNATTFKYTISPRVSIQDLTTETDNIHKYTYVGLYKSMDLNENSDSSEKVYSYCFNLYDNLDNLVATSGEKLHNSSLDTETNESIDTWTTEYGLQKNERYYISYHVKTINGLELFSNKYPLMDVQTVPSILFNYSDFKAIADFDNAYIKLILSPKLTKDRKIINGQFNILRSSDEDNFKSWHKIAQLTLTAYDTSVERFLCKDYSIAQGVKYKYAIQAFNSKGIFSSREETSIVYIDFEDMFLSDGKRQLKIKFNPKVSSFKNTILETKIDTLGGQYPTFFRNSNVKYGEIPISGLISTLMDDSEEFMSTSDLKSMSYRTNTPSQETGFSDLRTALTGENFKLERKFKMEVLDWLTNGKPKLFRSPGEGNFIVRLMNTSLSPNDTLGRMLHTFSSTAYEIAEYNFENLRKYGMITDPNIQLLNLSFIKTEDLNKDSNSLQNLFARVAVITSLEDNTIFEYQLQSQNTWNHIVIGANRTYIFPEEVLEENPLMKFRVVSGKCQLFYAYESINPENNNYITSITTQNNIEQLIGKNESIVEAEGLSIDFIYCLEIYKNPDAIGENLDYTFKLNKEDEYIDLSGIEISDELSTGGRIVLRNLQSVNYLYLGNGLIANITYKQINIEKSSTQDWEKDVIVNAI